MFNRILEMRAKAGKATELSTVLQEKILPILQKQPGFVDDIVLISNRDRQRFVALSFWQSEADAERYNREQYPAVHQLMIPFLEDVPKVENCSVDIFTTHNVVQGKAA